MNIWIHLCSFFFIQIYSYPKFFIFISEYQIFGKKYSNICYALFSLCAFLRLPPLVRFFIPPCAFLHPPFCVYPPPYCVSPSLPRLLEQWDTGTMGWAVVTTYRDYVVIFTVWDKPFFLKVKLFSLWAKIKWRRNMLHLKCLFFTSSDFLLLGLEWAQAWFLQKMKRKKDSRNVWESKRNNHFSSLKHGIWKTF